MRRVGELEGEVAVAGVDARHGAVDDPRIRFLGAGGRRPRHGCWLVGALVVARLLLFELREWKGREGD